jgi:glycosyltransferase involved in cell wall biosynthesis
MNTLPKISVVIPCYNAHRFLGQTLAGLSTQTYRDFELIIVDDGSTDPDTVAFLDSIDSEVRVIRQENRGLPGARNAGFRAARGEFVLPLDCDDWLDPSALEKLYLTVQGCPFPAFAYAQMQMEGDGQGVLMKNYNFFEQLFLNQLPYCILLRKDDWEAVGGYDELMRRGYEDWEFNIRLGAAGIRGVGVNEPLFHYRISQGGMLLSISGRAHADLWQYIRRKHASLYRLSGLIQLWRQWRRLPSTYPLLLFFPWLAAAVLLPNTLVSNVFGSLRRFSQGARVSASNRKRAVSN